MSTAQEVKVSIGGDEYTVQRFRGLKAIMAMASLTRLARNVPDIIADATKEYHARNTIMVTEAMSKLPRWEGFSKEDFDNAEAKTGVRAIELPAPVSQQEQVLAALPMLLEEARTEVIRLLAILLVPNAELRAADEDDSDGGVNAALDKYKELLLYEAEIDELVDLALAAQTVIGEQLGEGKKDRLMEMVRKLMTMMRGRTESPSTPSQTQSQEAATDLTLPTSDSDALISSTDSPVLTAGREQ